MIRPEIFLTVRALTHLVSKSRNMTGSNENSLLGNSRAFDLVITFLDYIKFPPYIFNPSLHHRAQRTIINKSCHRTIAL